MDVDWGYTIGWLFILVLVMAALVVSVGGFRNLRRTYTCDDCGGMRRRVKYVDKRDGYERYGCVDCGALYIREPGRKLVSYEQWKDGDGLPAARVVSKLERE